VMKVDVRISELEARLKDHDPEVRRSALKELDAAAKQGTVQLIPERDIVNMHCHSFYSYNAYGFSPSSLAWLAKRNGFRACGIVDFDVLDGVDEFLEACDLLGVRGSAGMETRVFIPEFSIREINSPGEPGIFYHMGIGFTSSAVPEEVAGIASDLRERAQARNERILARVNAHLDPVILDYAADVLPLAPGGTPTERHMVSAYVQKATDMVDDVVSFWVERLQIGSSEVTDLLNDTARFQNTVRKKLMKRGGVGYVEPGSDSFPSVEALNRLIVACGGLPCATWLDGISAGEQAMGELLEMLIGKGIVALNIVPDRNWNILDPALRETKVKNLYDVVGLADDLDLPLNVGTEMNSPGQRVVDDFDAPELAPVRQAFLDGADFVTGHTLMQRAVSMGYQSTWAQQALPTRRARCEFYAEIGRRVPPGLTGMRLLDRVGRGRAPDEILAKLSSTGCF